MESRKISLTLEKAREWYNSGSADLREVALQAYTEEELPTPKFTDIKTFKDACDVLGVSHADFNKMLKGYYGESIFKATPASIAAIKLNIIRQALNKGQKIELTKGTIYYPCTPFVTRKSTYYNDELRDGRIVEVAQFMSNGEVYRLLGGSAHYGSDAGLGYFYSSNGVGFSAAPVGFLGCASKEIAEHMSRYFAKEIFKAKYGDLVSYEWV